MIRLEHSTISLDASSIFMSETTGFMTLTARVSRIGCMPYKEPFKKKIHYELKLPEELFHQDTMETFSNLAVTDGHPKELLVTPKNSGKLMKGFTGPGAYTEHGYYLCCSLTITEHSIINRILDKLKNGEDQQVSCGYLSEVEDVEGVWNDIPYHKIQRNIRFNHLALVDVGRAGDEVKLKLNEGISEYDTLQNDSGVLTELAYSIQDITYR